MRDIGRDEWGAVTSSKREFLNADIKSKSFQISLLIIPVCRRNAKG